MLGVVRSHPSSILKITHPFRKTWSLQINTKVRMKVELTIASYNFFGGLIFTLLSLFLPFPLHLSHPMVSLFLVFLSLSSTTSKAPAIKPLDAICFHTTLVRCTRPCSACNCMTGHGQFVLQRPSINSIQKAFLAGGTQPSSHWPLPLLSSPSYLWSCSDKNYKKSHIWTTAHQWLLMLKE